MLLLGFIHEGQDLSECFSSSSWSRSRWICRVRWPTDRLQEYWEVNGNLVFTGLLQRIWSDLWGLAFLAPPAKGIVWEPWAHGKESQSERNSRSNGAREIVHVASMHPRTTLLSFHSLSFAPRLCTLCESRSLLILIWSQVQNWLKYCSLLRMSYCTIDDSD